MNNNEKAEMAEKNLGLVYSLANRFRGRGVPYEELYSAGCIGLMKAVHGFDPSRGFCFSTYAVPVILGEIKRVFRDGGAIKISRSLKELSLKVTKKREELAKNGREPKISEIAESMGLSIEEVSEAIEASLPPISLTLSETSSGSNGTESGGEFDLPIEAPQVKLIEIIALKQTLIKLSPEDRKLIYLRYWENKTQAEVGKILNMNQVQVSRREKKLLEYMRGELI